MRERVIAFLAALGVPDVGRDPLLAYVIQNVTQTVLTATNQARIPEGLEAAAVSMVAGQYLHLKKGAGQLSGFDLEVAEKQISEGDTSITFAIGEGSQTPEQRLDGLIAHLMTSGGEQFTAYRRLKW